MGAPNNELIPAGILLDHPGLDREEFITALNATRSSESYACDVSRNWDDHGPANYEDDRCHRGIFGFAEILGLERTEYRTTMERLMRETNFYQEEEYFSVLPRKKNDAWQSPQYRFRLRTSDAIGELITIENVTSSKPLARGMIVRQFVTGQMCSVDQVVSQRPTEPMNEDDEIFMLSTITARTVTPQYAEEQYDDLPSMLAVHPDVDPEKMYDFTAERGRFGHLDPAPWIQKDGRYFLDTKHLWETRSEHLLTSIHLAASAIQLKAWNLFCYDGARHVQRFLADHPEARDRHDRAVLHWWVAKHAHQCQMTNHAMLRLLVEIHTSKRHDPDTRALLTAELVEEEGFGWGRYLRNADAKEFTAIEREELAHTIATSGNATPWLRRYVEQHPKPVVLSTYTDEDQVPF
jgi:hypothetical protein